jgi:excisionase family DNA binding protein
MPKRMLLTLPEAAEQLRVSTRTIRRIVACGDLPAIVIRRAVRIRATDLRTYVDECARNLHTGQCAGPDVRKGDGTCHTDATIVPFGGRLTSTQAERELDALLEQQTGKKPKL